MEFYFFDGDVRQGGGQNRLSISFTPNMANETLYHATVDPFGFNLGKINPTVLFKLADEAQCNKNATSFFFRRKITEALFFEDLRRFLKTDSNVVSKLYGEVRR